MNIFLDTDDLLVVAKASDAIAQKYPNTIISKGIKEIGLSPAPDKVEITANIYYGSDLFDHLSVEQARLAQYAFATDGAVLFTDKPRKEVRTPIYSGTLATGSSDRILVHLDYAKRRSDEIKALPVKFFGVTQQDPKNVLVIDNKSPEKNLPLILSVLEHAPDNWWHNLAFVSTANAEYLREFFEDTMSFATPVAMTPSAVAKLRSVGVEFTDASDIELGPRGGLLLRERTRRANDHQMT